MRVPRLTVSPSSLHSAVFVGLALFSVATGDKIVLIDNAWHFIVFRPFHEDFYRFCGVAYVHGLMDYEAWQSWSKTDFQPESLSLV